MIKKLSSAGRTKIKNKTQTVRFRLNESFYDKTIIKEALDDFRNICKSKTHSYIEIELTSKDKVDYDLEDEFCNYVLGLMKNKTII